MKVQDRKPAHTKAKTLWLVTFLLPNDDRAHRAQVSAWTSEYACYLVGEDQLGAFVTSCEAVD